MMVGALLAFVGVGLGAFGAHGLRSRLDNAAMDSWETGIRYHQYHALATIMIGLVLWWRGLAAPPLLTLAPWFFVAGTVLFSGSLYLLALTGRRRLGAITPLGGVLLLAGWLALATALWKG